MTTLAQLYTASLPAEGERSTSFRCSSLGSCIKKQILLRDPRVKTPALSVRQRRMFRHRTLVHDDHVRSYAPVAVVTEYTLTEGLPEGVRGRCDALLHLNCCSTPTGRLNELLHRWIDREDDESRLELNTHTLTQVDTKTAHPNFVNFTDLLPKQENCLQVAGYCCGWEGLGIRVGRGMVDYIPVGSQSEGIEHEIPRLDEWKATARAEWKTLQSIWHEYSEAEFGSYRMPPLALVPKVVNRGTEIALVQSWECGYCDLPKAGYCQPTTTVYQKGDTIAVKEDGGWVPANEKRLKAARVTEDQAWRYIKVVTG